MSKKKHNLIVVAHPDDETIFFGGLIQQSKRLPWHVVCVTDGNADGKGAERQKQFQQACQKLKVWRTTFFHLPDFYEKRLDIQTLQNKFSAMDTPHEIFTHGPLGEYGHPHHQDVCYATHHFFSNKAPVWAVAHNCRPEKVIKLTPDQFRKKTDILSKIYFSETERFINFVPATAMEGFVRFQLREIEALYNFFLSSESPSHFDQKNLKKYKWLQPYLPAMKATIRRRPF